MPIKWCMLMMLLAAAAALALCGGAEWFTPEELLSPSCRLILRLRLMRLATAFIAGAGLAVSGAACQAVLRNDLAEPYLLGISGGAGIGVGGEDDAFGGHPGVQEGLFQRVLLGWAGDVGLGDHDDDVV